MQPLHRELALKRAEGSLRQGRIGDAIAEYEEIVEQQPSDWHSAKVLADLYLRVGETARGAAEYKRISVGLDKEGSERMADAFLASEASQSLAGSRSFAAPAARHPR